jgi:NADPH:quinone reductase-like Zn-dependent oxidoreductase
MKAILVDRYGPPSILQLSDIDKPQPAADQVLVRIRAASVNPVDWHLMRGDPFIARIGEWRRPKSPLVGRDGAGVVAAVGGEVTGLQVGDEVYGVAAGTFGEYVTGTKFVRKPANLSFEEAAAVPIAGCTALQSVRDQAKVAPGQRVAVHGAGGGVGTFAVQIAKAYGAHVTAVTSTSKLELARSLGADAVVDYARDDFLSHGPYDVILDVAGRGSIRRLRRGLAPAGRLVLVGAGHGPGGPLMHIAAAMLRSSLLRQRVVFAIASINEKDLAALRELIEAGQVNPVIDRTYSLAETAAAVAYVEQEQARGKVVIKVRPHHRE